MSSSQFGVQPSRLGVQNLAGDDNALFLKIFSGEIIQVFEEANLMLPLTTTRSISNGKMATFPVVGTASAKYHTPGESVMQQDVTNTISGAQDSEALTQTAANKYLSRLKHSERKISIDDVLVSTAFIADIDEAKNHWDVRSAYTTQIGRELSYHADRALIRTVIAGARADKDRFGVASGTSTEFLGAQINTTGNDTTYTATELIEGIMQAAQKMDEKNVPAEDRVCLLKPAEYYKLVSADNVAVNRDVGGEGSVASGMVPRVGGIAIMKTNHLPAGTDAADSIFKNAGINNDVYDEHDSSGSVGVGYSAAAAYNTAGIIFQKEAVGTVKLLDLAVESEYQMDRLGTLMLAKYAMGHGVLREECCYELITA